MPMLNKITHHQHQSLHQKKATLNANAQMKGLHVRRAPDSAALWLELAEEMSFAYSEKLEEKSIDEENIEERRSAEFKSLFSKIKKTYKGKNDSEKSKNQHLQNTKKFQSLNAQEMITLLEKGGDGDKAKIFFQLVEISETEHVSSLIQDTAKHAAQIYAGNHQASIQAGINISFFAESEAQKTGIDFSELQASYQETASDYRGILPALTMLLHRTSAEDIPLIQSFLREAARKDLASVKPSSDKAQLLHLLSELKGLEVFQSIQDKIGKILDDMQKQDKSFMQWEKKDLTTDFIETAEKPIFTKQKIIRPVSTANIQTRILFFQHLRNALKFLPEYVFDSEETKKRALKPLQNEIDRLTLEEEA